METINMDKSRKAVDIPADSIRSLALAAASKGVSLKRYMENIIISQAEKIDTALENPSPSGDSFFADQRNIERIQYAVEQSKEGKTSSVRSKDELYKLLESI
jgi:hypothetical protein